MATNEMDDLFNGGLDSKMEVLKTMMESTE